MLRSGREEGAGAGGNHGEISRNMCDFFPSPPFFSLGSRPTRQLVSMGIPAPAFHQDTLPASSASAAGPTRRGGQVYFLPGGPFEVAVRPLPHQHWSIRWGSLKRRRWDSFIATALHLCWTGEATPPPVTQRYTQWSVAKISPWQQVTTP